MEEAKYRKEDTRSAMLPLSLVIAPVFVSGAIFALSGQKLALIGGGALAVAFALMLLPMRHAILFLFLYLFLDGALKIFSNYNPLFHVAQDLIVIGLCARSAMARGNGGLNKISRTPFFPLILLFVTWIAIQYINPFGLGLLPSIAGTKVYITSICVFLLAYHHFDKKDLEPAVTWLVALGLAEGILATVEYLFFQGYAFSISPRYAQIAGDQFVGDLFRPFGTTVSPGAPSVWIFLTAGMATYLVGNASTWLGRTLGAAHLLIAVPTLFFCQTRASVILTGLGVALILFRPQRGLIKRAAFGLVGAAAIAVAANIGLAFLASPSGHKVIPTSQLESLTRRVASLSNQATMQDARSGAGGNILKLAGQQSLFGIGLSRVGAASAVWNSRIDADPYFDHHWSFVDNLYLALFTELGVFGLIFWVAIVLTPSLYLMRASMDPLRASSAGLLWLCGSYSLLYFIGGFGSEGLLYNPCSGFLWLVLAIGLREAQHARS